MKTAFIFVLGVGAGYFLREAFDAAERGDDPWRAIRLVLLAIADAAGMAYIFST